MPIDRRELLASLACQIRDAEQTVRPVAPISEQQDDLGIADAYAIQTDNVNRRVAAGSVVRGRKVGLTSRAVQEFLGADEPDFGVLLDDMFVDEDDEVPVSTLIQPRIEAQIAFIMGRDLAGPGVTVTDALVAVAGAAPAIEIADSRIAQWRIRLVDTIADNASSARVVVGGRLNPVAGLDLRLVGMLLHRNGATVDSGAGAAALGNPARGVAWLANKLATFGMALRAGEVVLTGGLHRRMPTRPGDVFQAEFAHLGSVTARFANGDET
jgi:2-keto-4-pentenoate hydratase